MVSFQFYRSIMQAIRETGLDKYLENEGPVAFLGPGYDVNIRFEIDPNILPRWEQLIVSPSESEHPNWRAQLTNIIEDKSVPADDELPWYRELKEALQPIVEALRKEEQDNRREGN